MNKIFYYRTSDGIKVSVDGNPVQLKPSLKLFNHSPNGFEIGYGGSGPAQLALAILMMFVNDNDAVRLHQQFKWQVLSKVEYFETDLGAIEIDIPRWIQENVADD